MFSQTVLELRSSLGTEGKDGKNLKSQTETWPGTPRRPSSFSQTSDTARLKLGGRFGYFLMICARGRGGGGSVF